VGQRAEWKCDCRIGNREGRRRAARGRPLREGGSTYGTFWMVFKGTCSVGVTAEMRARSRESTRGCNGDNMRKILMLAGILVFAGAARAQVGGSLNSGGSVNKMGSLNGGSGRSSDADAANTLPDSTTNRNSSNPGIFVPSTFTSYGKAVELGKLEALMKPMSLAEAARLAQEQRKNAAAKPVIVLDKDGDGKLVIAPRAKQ